MNTERIYKDLGDTTMTITVKVKHVYGAKMVYPICDKAQIFAQLAGHTVLTQNTLDCVRRLGYLIEVQQEVIGL